MTLERPVPVVDHDGETEFLLVAQRALQLYQERLVFVHVGRRVALRGFTACLRLDRALEVQRRGKKLLASERDGVREGVRCPGPVANRATEGLVLFPMRLLACYTQGDQRVSSQRRIDRLPEPQYLSERQPEHFVVVGLPQTVQPRS